MGYVTGDLEFHHWSVLWVCFRKDAQSSAPDDRPLPRQRIYKFVGGLHTNQGFNRCSGPVWRGIFTRYCPNDPDDLVDKVFHITLAER